MTLPRVLSELVRSLKLNPELPDACEAEAAALVAKPGIDDPTLVDLTRLAFCTIDEPHSLDLDQALHVEPTVEGWRLHYAIADAAWFVRPDTALFDEALKRGATCYIPGLVVPMLPRSLSEGLVSLNPNVDRRALVFDVDVDRDGSVRAHRLVRGRIHSRAKLSYDGVQAWLDGGVSETDDPEVLASLRALVDMGKARLAEARSRNVLVVRRAEVDVRLDGLRFVALDGARNDVERYNEQVSLLCNILGAQRLARSASDEVQGVFRVHAPPEPIRMAEFRALTHTLAVAHERPELAWGDETLSAFVRRIPDEGPGVAVHRAALRTGGRSGYAPKPAMHHGVGAREYARFTAPMREVVGVFTHKEAWELVLGLPGTDDDEALRLQVIQSASRSHSRQRRVDKAVNRAVLDQVLADGKARSATLLEVSESRAVLRVDDPAIELNAYLRDLPGASVDGITLKLATGSARVGDPIEVRAIDVDAEADRWRISLTP